MDIKLTGNIPFTNQGWFFLLKKDREATSKKLLEIHADRFPSGKAFPKSNPKHMQGVVMLLANMPAHYREKEIEYIARWQLSDVSSYMSVVQSWDTLTDKEKGYLSMALSSRYDSETDNLMAVNLFEELYRKGIDNRVLYDSHKNYNMTHFFIGHLLLSDIPEVQQFALTKLTESNQIINYQSVVDMLRQDGRITYDEQENVDLLIQRFREGKSFPSGRALEIIRANKEKFVNALTLEDPVFTYQYGQDKEFGYASLLYVEKHGAGSATAIVNKNRKKNGTCVWTSHFLDNFPHLVDGITLTDLMESNFIQPKDKTYIVNMYQLPGSRVAMKHRKYTATKIKRVSEMLNHMNFFMESEAFITHKQDYDRDHPYMPFVDYVIGNTKEKYAALLLLVGNLHYGLMLPLGLDAPSLLKSTFKTPWAFKQEVKEYCLQPLFDGKVLRKIKEGVSWNDIPEIGAWINQEQVEQVVSFDEMNLLF